MKSIISLLERFNKSVGNDLWKKDAIIASVKNSSKILLESSEIHIWEGVLEISVGSTVKKNEIRMKEKNILQDLQDQKLSIKEIRYR